MMSETKYTAGPWFVSGSFVGLQFSPESGIQIKVARASGDECDGERNTNARLIAAAPADMLEALKECLKLFDNVTALDDGGSNSLGCAENTIRNAIAKVEGRNAE